MNILDLTLIAVALSLDAFSVSISCGIKLPPKAYKKFLKISLAFALFQAVMPLGGHLLTRTLLATYISAYSKWISFSVFLLLGAKTIYDFFFSKESDECKSCNCTSLHCLTGLAVATSIDAFLVGGVLGLQGQSLLYPLILIGVITLMNSMIGCLLGNRSVTLLKEKARLLAGLILIALAIKSLF